LERQNNLLPKKESSIFCTIPPMEGIQQYKLQRVCPSLFTRRGYILFYNSSQASFQERNFGFPLKELTQESFIDYVFGDFKGYLCLSVKNKQGTLWNVFYNQSEQKRMNKYLANIYGNDTYISYSTYYQGIKKWGAVRKQGNIHKTYMLVQDLDYYKMEMDDAIFLQKIQQKIKNNDLLMPNILLFTGRGYQLITVIKAIKNIKGYENDRKWRKIQKHQMELLKEFHSDPVVLNPSALTRFPGSKNRKSQNNVYAFMAKSEKYDLDDIVAFYQLNSQQNSPIQIKENSNSSKSYQKRNNNFRKFDQKSSPLHNIHKLNQARIDDIFTYVRIKNRKHESYIGIRNKLALIVRFHSLIVHQGNRDTAETDVKELIDEMDRRETSQEELLRRSQSAERYYNEWLNGDWDRHKYVQGGLFYTNQTLVELLGMQRDYSMQLQLKTIKI